MMKSLMREQQKAEDKGLFASRCLRDFEARISKLSDKVEVLKADKERALKRVVMLEAERGGPLVTSAEFTAWPEEKAKLAEELRLEKSIREKT